MPVLGLGTDASADYTWTNVTTLLGHVIQIVFTAASAVAIIYIIYGSILYITAYGSEEKATSAKNTVLYAIIGLIVIIASKLIITWVWNFVADTSVPLHFLY